MPFYTLHAFTMVTYGLCKFPHFLAWKFTETVKTALKFCVFQLILRYYQNTSAFEKWVQADQSLHSPRSGFSRPQDYAYQPLL
jgi:hypothetical protein